MSEATTELIVPNLPRDIERHLRRIAQVLPHQSNWASGLADPCLRRMTYYRTHWEAQAKPEPYLQGIFETGKKLERVIINILNDIGERSKPQWELAAHGIRLNDKLLKQHQIGCNPDVFLKVWPPEGSPDDRPRFLGPVDIKTSDPNVFRQINSVEDFDRKPYLRRYPAQVMTYELAANFETGWLLVVNKSNLYEIKMIEIPMDYGYMESLLQKADTVNAHVTMGTLPDQLNEAEECAKCAFAALCCPSCTTGKGLAVRDHEELEVTLERLDELQPTAKEIGILEKHRDALLATQKGTDLLCGSFLVQWKHLSGVHPPKPEQPWEQWRKSITRVIPA